MQTNDAGTVEQIAALESLVPDLERLGKLLADARASKLRAVHDFASDNPDLQRLEEMLAEAKAQPVEFDLFEVLNMWWQEDIHSRLLTWLLGPNNSHGVGDHFLKTFLAHLDLPDCIGKTTDWSMSESQGEWYCVVDGSSGWLDILVTNADAKFACAIENKIFSPEGGRQLTHYRKALEALYPDPEWTRRYVFLSPSGMESQWEDEQEYWKPMRYTTILQLVEQTIDDKRAAMSKDARSFLRQYAATLRRNKIVPESTEIAKLAREIYLEYREVIDLIKSHEPDWQSETVQILKEAVVKQSNWKLDLSDRNFVRFRSVDWDRFEDTQTGNGWAPSSNSLLLFQFRFYDQMPWLDLGLSTGDDTNSLLRNRLFESIRQRPDLFRLKTTSLTDGWAILHEEKDYILDDSDYGVGWDDGTTRAKIESWVKNFAEKDFPAMNDVIVKCLEDYEAETKGQ